MAEEPATNATEQFIAFRFMYGVSNAVFRIVIYVY